MAVQHGFGSASSTNLIFGYDTIDTANSYLGEPTTNAFTNPAFTSGTSGWTFGSWDSGRYTYTTENTMGPFGEIVPALKVIRTTSDTSYAHFHQNNGGKFTNGNTYTISAYVKGAGTLGQYNQGGYGPITYSPGQLVTLTNNWQRISYTLTSQTNSLYPYWAAEGITQNVPMYFTFAQAEQNSHATPFVNGTRTATAGLLDLTGNHQINIANTSFNNSAQIVFDGTTDLIYTQNSDILNPNSNSFTIETVFNCSNSNTGEGILYNKENLYEGAVQGQYFRFAWQPYWSWEGSTTFSVASNTWYHSVVTYDKSRQRMYKNGVEVFSRAQGGNIGSNSNVLSIGARGVDTNGGSGYNFFPGQIPITRIYNRALSQAEITQNFKKYQTRFGIA